MHTRHHKSILLAGLLVALAGGTAAWGGVIQTSPLLPPENGEYLTAQQVHAMYPAGNFPETILSDISHSRFFNPQREDVGPDEIETFDSTVTGVADIDGFGIMPIVLTGPVQVQVFGKAGQTTGTFDTEIIAMSLSGSVGGMPVVIREIDGQENPAQPSTGQTTITDLGGGLWNVDSFFDVFTELSVNNSAFTAATGPVTVNLKPEPSSLLLLTASGLALLSRRRAAGSVITGH